MRAAVLFGAITLMDASVFLQASTAPGDQGPWELTESSRLEYITDILRESRTGLSGRQEEVLARVILEESLANELDPLLVMALIKTESTFYNWAKSYKGARGLMQIMPSTGRWVAAELDLEWDGDRTLYNPFLNVRLGIRYISMLRDRYGDDTFLTLAAYNEGPTRLSRVLREGGAPPERYARKVLAYYEDFAAESGFAGYN